MVPAATSGVWANLIDCLTYGGCYNPRALASLVSAVDRITSPPTWRGRPQRPDHTSRYRGPRASALMLTRSAEGSPKCRCAGTLEPMSPFENGRTSLVAFPEHDDVLLSAERLCVVHDIVPLSQMRSVPKGHTSRGAARRVNGWAVFGVNLSAPEYPRPSVAWRRTPADCARSRYGSMGGGFVELGVALPDGTVLRRHSRSASRQHRLRPARAVRRGRNPGGYHCAGSAAAPPSREVTAVCGFTPSWQRWSCRPNIPAAWEASRRWSRLWSGRRANP